MFSLTPFWAGRDGQGVRWRRTHEPVRYADTDRGKQQDWQDGDDEIAHRNPGEARKRSDGSQPLDVLSHNQSLRSLVGLSSFGRSGTNFCSQILPKNQFYFGLF
jgi:hypothetical protein